MNKFITFIFYAIIFIGCSNVKAQSRFNNYLSVFCKQICLTDNNLIIDDKDYMTFENRWLKGFEYEDFLPQSFLVPNMDNCYFMLKTQYGRNTIGLVKLFYDEDETDIAKYLFIMYNESGEIIDTLCLLSGKYTYLDIDDFFMSYIVLSRNEIQHVCIGPFSTNDVKTTCKKVTYIVTEKGFYYKTEKKYGVIMIPDKATDIRL